MYRLFTLAVLLTTSIEATAANYQQWHEQLEQLVARNAWDGANTAYHGVVDTAKKPTSAEHLLGARAAMALGNMNDALERLERADPEDPAVAKALDRIRDGYGRAKLKVPGSHSGAVSLVARDNPIDSGMRRTVELAKKILEANGKYSGLLPVGRFRLGQTEFEVISGEKAKAKLK